MIGVVGRGSSVEASRWRGRRWRGGSRSRSSVERFAQSGFGMGNSLRCGKFSGRKRLFHPETELRWRGGGVAGWRGWRWRGGAGWWRWRGGVRSRSSVERFAQSGFGMAFALRDGLQPIPKRESHPESEVGRRSRHDRGASGFGMGNSLRCGKFPRRKRLFHPETELRWRGGRVARVEVAGRRPVSKFGREVRPERFRDGFRASGWLATHPEAGIPSRVEGGTANESRVVADMVGSARLGSVSGRFGVSGGGRRPRVSRRRRHGPRRRRRSRR